jgi:hypothetical protein
MNHEGTDQPLAIDVRVVGSRYEEVAQVVFNLNGDERQPLAALALLAIHAEELDNIGVVELAPRQSFDT